MKVSTHALYLVTILSLFALNQKKEDLTEKYRQENANLFIECGNTMNDLSLCYSTKADETYKATICNRELYKLRDWLRQCKPVCGGK